MVFTTSILEYSLSFPYVHMDIDCILLQSINNGPWNNILDPIVLNGNILEAATAEVHIQAIEVSIREIGKNCLF